MSLFLQQVADENPGQQILMVLDGAGWHRAKTLRVPDSITLYRLPPYCPELNPAEHLWDELREKFFANLAFDHMDSLIDHLAHSTHLLHQETERIKSLCGFHWIINV